MHTKCMKEDHTHMHNTDWWHLLAALYSTHTFGK